MHELSIMGSILDIVLEHAAKNGAKRVKAVNLRIGELSDIIPEWAQMYFDMLSKETIAEKAELVIDRVPLSILCRDCGNVHTFTDKNWKFTCPKCESSNIELKTGREMTVTSIEID